MSTELINEINAKCPTEQGIFREPFGVDSIKEPVIYMRWLIGGQSGAGYHMNSYSHPVEADSRPDFHVLDLVINQLCPNISEADRKEMDALIHSSEGDDCADYYGNYDVFSFEYVILSELENKLNKITPKLNGNV